MSQHTVNFMDAFLRGRRASEEIEDAKENRKMRQDELKVRLKELDEVIKARQAELAVTKEKVKNIFRQRLISGEDPLPSIKTRRPEIEGIFPGGSEEEEMILPDPITRSPGRELSGENLRRLQQLGIEGPLGTYTFNPQDIISARQQMKEQLRSMAGVEAEAAGMKQAAITQAEEPERAAVTERTIGSATIQELGRRGTEILRQNFEKQYRETPEQRKQRELEVAEKRRRIGSRLGDERINSSVIRIADQHDRNPLTKRALIGQEALSFVQSLDPESPADNIGLIYAFAKAMDPESVVREGEYKTVQKWSQAWKSKFGFDVLRILENSKFLTPEAQKLMIETIRKRVGATLKIYEPYRKNTANRIKIASKDQVDAENYLGDFSFSSPQETKEEEFEIIGTTKYKKVNNRMVEVK